MSSGRVQLSAAGIQDKSLTGSPQVTFFVKNFSRFSKFALEVLEVPFDQPSDFGAFLACTVPRFGQLIRGMYLKLVLPPLVPDTCGYTDSIGNAVVDHADLLIGGKVIERINGEYMQLYSQTFLGESQQNALTYLVGDTKGSGLGPASVTATKYGPYPRTLLVPLPFYFNRSDPLAVPLCALTRQEVEVQLKLRTLDKLIAGGLSATAATQLQVSLAVEYVFMGDDAVSLFQNSTLDYPITQLQQFSGVINPGETSTQLRFEFVNPVKELFMVIQDQDADTFDFRNASAGNTDQLASLRLEFNGEVILSDVIADEVYLSINTFLQCHTRVPEIYAYCYSFAIDPENYLPTGQVNMSRIQNKIGYLTTTPNPKARNVRVYAKSYNVLRVKDGIAGVIFMDNNFF